MKTFNVSYKLYGTIPIKADSEKEAKDKIQETSNRTLLDNCSMDGDAIEVFYVDELEVEE